MPLYTSTGAFNVAVNDTTGTGRYSASGALRINLVTGASYVGLYAADGALNVVDVSGIAVSTYGGLYHPSGAIRGRTAPTTLSGLQAPDGSYYFLGLFSPLNLFANGEQGAWYDPSDFSTMFTDAAGTTPVTAVEQPVGLLLDKSKGLALGSETVINGDCSSSTGWISGGAGWTITGGQLVMTAAASSGIVYQQYSDGRLTAGKTYKVTFDIVSVSAGSARIDLWGATTANGVYFSTSGTKTCYIVAPSAPVGMQFTVSGPFTGTIDNISVRELPGNHASQSTPASRPVLSARVNQLTYTEALSNAVWTSGAISNGSRTNGSMSVSTNEGYVYINTYVGALLTAPTASYTISFDVTCDQTIANVPIRTTGNTNQYTLENLTSGITKRVSISGLVPSFATGIVSFGIDARDAVVPGGSNATGYVVTFDKIDLRVTNVGVNLPAYQRVAAATDYDTTGFPLYLKFDGVDDSLATASIDFTATDKMSVVAGVRKLSDAAIGIVAELSANSSSNNGAFYLSAPNSASANYVWSVKGSVGQNQAATTNIYPAPLTNVLTGLGDISGDSVLLRINGAQVASDLDDNGTGNFGNYPLYIGRRAGSAFPYNGNLYSLLVRGALSTDAQIASTETYVNSKTGAY